MLGLLPLLPLPSLAEQETEEEVPGFAAPVSAGLGFALSASAATGVAASAEPGALGAASFWGLRDLILLAGAVPRHRHVGRDQRAQLSQEYVSAAALGATKATAAKRRQAPPIAANTSIA